jgi:hypothetical protein
MVATPRARLQFVRGPVRTCNRAGPFNGIVRPQMTTYWRVFNFMIRRVVAVGFMVVGVILVVTWLPSLLDPNGSIPVNGIPDHDLGMRLFGVVLPAIVAVLGVLLFRSKPYDPDRNTGGTSDA